MKLKPILQALLPIYGAPQRFRLCLRLREYLRKNHMYYLGTCLKNHMLKTYGCELSIHAKISVKASFMHTTGVVIGEGVTVKDHVVIMGNVTLGRKDFTDELDYPTVESGVTIGTGAAILGRISVAENSVIGAHALVLASTEPYGVYAGVPAKRIK